jgi:type I restriction enzyme S subunit
MGHYKPYPAYKDSGVEWLGLVPEHWQIKRLKHIANVQTGVAKGKDNEGKDIIEVPYLRVANVQDGYLSLDDVTTIEIPREDLERYSLQPGDVLMNEGGDFDKLGRGSVWQGEIEPCIHQNHVFAVRPTAVPSEWLNAFTGSLAAQFYFMGRAKQSTNLASISSSNIMELPVAMPPAAEIDLLLAHIDRETARLDALVAKKTRFTELLREKRQALITHAVTKGLDPNVKMKDTGVEWLGEVPEHWEIKRLRFAVTLNPSIRPDLQEDPTCEVSFLPMEAIGEDGSLRLEQSRAVQDVRNGYSYFEDGDVAFAKVTPCFENGKGALMQGLQCAAGFGTTELTVMRPLQDFMDARHLSYIVQSTQFRSLGAAAMTGAGGLKRVPDEFTRNFLVALPPRPERELIGDHLDREATRIDALLRKTERSIELLKERRTALITAAVTGQIDLREHH